MRDGTTVYVPRAGSVAGRMIDRGSGIVGTVSGGLVTIDYEGNRFGASNIVTWADRVYHAWDRHTTDYPTVARMTIDPIELNEVGKFDATEWLVRLDPGMAWVVAEWNDARFDVGPALDAQCKCTHGRSTT